MYGWQGATRMTYEEKYIKEVQLFNNINYRFEKIQENDIVGAYRLMIDSLQAFNRWSKIREDIRRTLARGQGAEIKDRLEEMNRYLKEVHTVSRMIWSRAKDEYKTMREDT